MSRTAKIAGVAGLAGLMMTVAIVAVVRPQQGKGARGGQADAPGRARRAQAGRLQVRCVGHAAASRFFAWIRARLRA